MVTSVSAKEENGTDFSLARGFRGRLVPEPIRSPSTKGCMSTRTDGNTYDETVLSSSISTGKIPVEGGKAGQGFRNGLETRGIG